MADVCLLVLLLRLYSLLRVMFLKLLWDSLLPASRCVGVVVVVCCMDVCAALIMFIMSVH